MTVPPAGNSSMDWSAAQRSRQGGLWAGVHVAKLPRPLIDLPVEEGRIGVRPRRAVQEAVHSGRQGRERYILFGRQNPQGSLHHGHDERRGHSLSRHVGEGNADALASQIEES